MIGRNSCFTLMEVLIALAILSLGVLAGTALLSNSKKRCLDAQIQWEEQHAMIQAAEYYLLVGAESVIPERFFPFNEYHIEAGYDQASGLPFDVSPQKNGWELVTMRISLSDERRNILREFFIDRIITSGKK